jgi:pilus assembly protein Flp/PilA
VSGLIRLGRQFLKDDGGATAIEYAIIGGLLSIVIVVAVNSIGSGVRARFDTVKTAFDSLN